jgi:hypothetical protein
LEVDREVRNMRKLLVIWLDGYDVTLANAMINELPSLAMIREKSARFLLDDGVPAV